MDRYLSVSIFGFLLIASPPATRPVSAENEAEAFRRLKESRIDTQTGLPRTPDPESFEGEVGRGYEIARENPVILSPLPCPYGCETVEHENLLDCFVSDHAST